MPSANLPGAITRHELDRSHVRAQSLVALPRATDRALTRFVCYAAFRQVTQVAGWEHILPDRDPFLLVANHSSRREAVYLPALLLLARGGRPVRFLADWNFRLIPGVGYLYRRTGTITLLRKDARPRILNLLRPLFRPGVPPLEEAKHHLLQGGSVAIFPEGTVNRNAERLLRGRRAAARLSLETQVPVVPVGIRFARWRGQPPRIDTSSAISLHIGEAMIPENQYSTQVTPRQVSDWNRRLMAEIAHLSGKKTDDIPA